MGKHSQKFTRQTIRKKTFQELLDLIHTIQHSQMFITYSMDAPGFARPLYRIKAKTEKPSFLHHHFTKDMNQLMEELKRNYWDMVPECPEPSDQATIERNQATRDITLMQASSLFPDIYKPVQPISVEEAPKQTEEDFPEPPPYKEPPQAEELDILSDWGIDDL